MHVLSVDDLSRRDILAILQDAADMKAAPETARGALDGRTLLMLFAKPSMRTRISFETAMTQLGGHAIAYDLKSSTLGSKETFADFGAVASRYVDAIVARLFEQRDLEALGSRATVPVVNGLTDHEHPCQALGDLLTLAERGGIPGATVAYVGDAHNNVTHSLLLAGAKVGVDVRVACPPSLAPDARVLARARELARESGAAVTVSDDPRLAVRGADFVYTDTWMSYHVDPAERDARRATLEPYRVDEALMREAGHAWFLHCLPATRGDEVTDAVLDSPASLVLDQAENRLHAQKALLAHLLAPALTGDAAPRYA